MCDSMTFIKGKSLLFSAHYQLIPFESPKKYEWKGVPTEGGGREGSNFTFPPGVDSSFTAAPLSGVCIGAVLEGKSR